MFYILEHAFYVVFKNTLFIHGGPHYGGKKCGQVLNEINKSLNSLFYTTLIFCSSMIK